MPLWTYRHRSSTAILLVSSPFFSSLSPNPLNDDVPSPSDASDGGRCVAIRLGSGERGEEGEEGERALRLAPESGLLLPQGMLEAERKAGRGV